MRLYEFDWKDIRRELSSIKDYSDVERADKIYSKVNDHYFDLHLKLVEIRREVAEFLVDKENDPQGPEAKKLAKKFETISKLESKYNDLRFKLARRVQEIGGKHPDIREELERNGFEHVGDGAYGVVFKKGNIVAKVFDRKDKCFLKFVHFARKRVANPFLPKYSRVTKRIFEGEVSYLVFTEALEEIDEDIQLFLRSTKFELVNLKDSDKGSEKLIDELEEKYPGLTQVLVDLQKEFKGVSCYWDTHGGNFMMRGDQIVITDPYAVNDTDELNNIGTGET